MGLSDGAMEYETDDCQWEDQWTAAEIKRVTRVTTSHNATFHHMQLSLARISIAVLMH